MYIYIYIYICIHMYIYIYIYVCMYVYIISIVAEGNVGYICKLCPSKSPKSFFILKVSLIKLILPNLHILN